MSWPSRLGGSRAAASVPAYVGAWTGRPTAAAAGAGAWMVITGLPAANNRTYWYSDGTRWCPLGPQLVGLKTGITSGAIQMADQVIGQLGPFPAGLFDVGTVFKLRYSLGRNNNTDGYGTSTSIRMGTAGTVADPLIGNTNLSASFPAGSGILSLGVENESRVASTTNVQKLGGANGGTSFNGSGGSGAGLNSSLTISNVQTNTFFVSISTTMGGATATTPQTGYMDLWVTG